MEKKHKKDRIKSWHNAFFQAFWKTGLHNRKDFAEMMQLLYGFFLSDIKLMKRIRCRKKSGMAVLIAIVRDEKERMELFLEHYRKLGIRHFIIADNNSRDGTLQYLMNQKDVDVFLIRSSFRNGRKEGWINKLMYLYGFDRWYLVVDADELLEWPERKAYSLQRVIEVLEKNQIDRAGALMIDLYAKDGLFENNLRKDVQQELYFDTDTYLRIREGEKLICTGGPRKRVYDMDCYLSKYPLVCLREGEFLITSHYWYPYNRYGDYPFVFGLMHYKFLTKNDLAKVRQYVKEENHVSHSYEYKCYLEQYNKGNTSFYFERSVQYEGSASLKNIRYIRNISDFERQGEIRNEQY